MILTFDRSESFRSASLDWLIIFPFEFHLCRFVFLFVLFPSLAGLVFTPLTRPYLVDTFGRNWVKRSPVDLIKLAYYGSLEYTDQQVVILSTILVNDVNTGSEEKCAHWSYDSWSWWYIIRPIPYSPHWSNRWFHFFLVVSYGPSFHNIELISVNDKKIRNMKHLVQIVEQERKGSIYTHTHTHTHTHTCMHTYTRKTASVEGEVGRS